MPKAHSFEPPEWSDGGKIDLEWDIKRLAVIMSIDGGRIVLAIPKTLVLEMYGLAIFGGQK